MINKILRKFGYQLVKRSNRITETELESLSEEDFPYKENPEDNQEANVNLKLTEREKGNPFESRYILSVNKCAAKLIGDSKTIGEFGSGTGIFASEVVTRHEDVKVIASEIDKETHLWATENRSHPRITYLDRYLKPEDGPFDVIVSIDVIEHVKDYRQFLESAIQLAPKGIFATPNKNRRNETKVASPPLFHRHVREWTIGEFYWVLRAFYNNVKLYGVNEGDDPTYYPISLLSNKVTSMIAVCDDPYRQNGNR